MVRVLHGFLHELLLVHNVIATNVYVLHGVSSDTNEGTSKKERLNGSTLDLLATPYLEICQGGVVMPLQHSWVK